VLQKPNDISGNIIQKISGLIQADISEELHVGISHLFFRYIALYEARDFLVYFS